MYIFVCCLPPSLFSIFSLFPGISFGDVGKVIGERWKALSSEDKAPFEEKAAADKQRWVLGVAR